ncbi:fimbrial protein [Klebsiella aerogenes]|nr:type 1 fimbrial protein [Klebsiella aerogenes]
MTKKIKNRDFALRHLIMPFISGFGLRGLSLLFCLPVLISFGSWANEITLTFKYNVVAASCSLSVPSLKDLGLLDADKLVDQNWLFIGEDDVPVTLSGCTGTPEASTAPKITVKATAGTTVSGAGLFSGPESTSRGFGIAIGNAAGMTSLSQGGLLTKDGDDISLGKPGISATNTTYKIRVGVTCGSKSDCAAGKLQAGNLKASFTLDFHYK